jgi:spermidine synthase
VTGIRTAPNALVDETAAMAGSIFAAARLALPVVRATPGPDTLLVAGWNPQAATLDPDILAERWRRRGMASSSFGAAILPTLLPPGRVADMEASLLDASAAAVVSRDDRPASFLHALARRQRTTAAGDAGWLAPLGRAPAAALAVLALLPSLLALVWTRARPRSRERRAASAASHAVATAGAAGMGLSLLVLLSFQARVGLLYGALGVLSATFMLGLALGAALAQRTVEGVETDPVVPLRIALASAVAYAATLSWTLEAAAQASGPGLVAGLLAHGALLLAGGVVTGAVFPVSSAVRLRSGDDAASAAGRLESADHVGAALAALVTSVLFLPRLGFVRTAWLVAALLALGLAGTLLPGRDRGES